jgi:hypothetical protein
MKKESSIRMMESSSLISFWVQTRCVAFALLFLLTTQAQEQSQRELAGGPSWPYLHSLSSDSDITAQDLDVAFKRVAG